ncbi:MAG: CHASE2 domain-containing protein, partial [Burkholderiaceae bacterium]|nr:CHASE2 domain-containing protein [Burkholderiaceae bacterium]
FLYTGAASARYPHLALALLEAGGEAPPTRLSAVTTSTVSADIHGAGRDSRFLIRYAGPPGTVDRVSYVDVLRGDVPAERLTGHYVLIGMTAQGLGDTLATPVNGRHQAMPGVEVLANTLYTLRSGDTVKEMGPFQVAALSTGLLSALVLLAFGRFGTRTALLAAIGSVPMAVAASLWALRSGLWCSPVPYSLAALLAYPMWSWRRLERTVASLDGEIARIVADPLAAPGTDPQAATNDGDALDARLQTLQRAGALVRDARRFLADTLAAMPTAMLVGDEKMQVVLANPMAAALFDVESFAELNGLDLIRLLAEFSTLRPLDWKDSITELSPSSAGIAVEARLGTKGDFVVHLAAVDLQGQRRLIVTIADVEPVKQAQREREEALAFVSHDLRSPASSIVLLADLNLRGDVQTPRDELLHEVRRLATRTLEMSEDFVRAAQVQTRVLQRLPVQPRALIDAALGDLRAQAVAAGVNLHTRFSDADADVAVDGPLVVRAIGNLVSNAIKHSARGGEVELHASVDGGALRLTVRDHGPGLSPQQILQLAQGDQGAAVHDARGVGLGLLFVQRVARRHGGMLRAAAPTEGRGALFELELTPP